HRGLEGRERAQRRIEEEQTQNLAGECLRLGAALQAFGQREQLHYLLARKIRQVEKVFHRDLQIDERRAQPIDVFLFEYESGEQAQDGRIAGRARENVLREQRLLHVLGRFVQAKPVQETKSLEVDHRADLAGLAQVSRHAQDVLEQAFLLDR